MTRWRETMAERVAGTRPALLGLALALACAPAAAREDDRRQPAEIEADRAEIDRAAGVQRYYGNVVFTQGTLRITGDTVVVEATGGRVRRARAEGTPATVRQESDAGRLMRANGHEIDYEADVPRVTLTGDAELFRGSDRFAAGRIRYWPETGRVEAGGDGDGDRVRIRIEPEDDGEGDDADE